MQLPIKLNMRYTCQGTDAQGIEIVYDDLLYAGDMVSLGPNETGPYGEVIDREGQLWIEEIT
jgi:hypothetical protein